MSDPVYRRAIVKLSGEALSATSGFGIDQATVERLATDLAAAAKLGVELGANDLEAAHQLVIRAAELVETGEDTTLIAAHAKRFSVDAACRGLSAIRWACSRP